MDSAIFSRALDFYEQALMKGIARLDQRTIECRLDSLLVSLQIHQIFCSNQRNEAGNSSEDISRRCSSLVSQYSLPNAGSLFQDIEALRDELGTTSTAFLLSKFALICEAYSKLLELKSQDFSVHQQQEKAAYFSGQAAHYSQKARDLLQRSLQETRNQQDLLGQAASWNNLANALLSSHEYAEAVKYYSQARDLYDFLLASFNNIDVIKYARIKRYRADVLLRILRCQEFLGNEIVSVDDLKKVLSLRQELNDALGEAEVLNELGKHFFSHGIYGCPDLSENPSYEESKTPVNSSDAFYLATLCLDRFVPRSLSDNKRKIVESLKVRLGFANIFYVKGNCQRAIEECNSLSKLEDITLELKADSLDLLGKIYQTQGRLADAKRMLIDGQDGQQTPLEIHEQIDDRLGKINSLNNVGTLWRSLGQLSDSEERHREAYKLAKELGSLSGEVQSRHALGVLRRPGYCLNSVLRDLNTLLQDRALKATVLCDLGDFQLSLYDKNRKHTHIQRSLSFYQDSWDIANRIGHCELQAKVSAALGKCYFRASDFAMARQCLSNSFNLYESIENKKCLANIATSLGNSLIEQIQVQSEDIHVYRKAIDEYSKAETAIKAYSQIEDVVGFCCIVDKCISSQFTREEPTKRKLDTLFKLSKICAKRREYDTTINICDQVKNSLNQVEDCLKNHNEDNFSILLPDNFPFLEQQETRSNLLTLLDSQALKLIDRKSYIGKFGSLKHRVCFCKNTQLILRFLIELLRFLIERRQRILKRVIQFLTVILFFGLIAFIWLHRIVIFEAILFGIKLLIFVVLALLFLVFIVRLFFLGRRS